MLTENEVQKIMANRKFSEMPDQYLQKLPLRRLLSCLTSKLGKHAASGEKERGRIQELLSPRFEKYHKSDVKDNLSGFFASIRCKLGASVKTSTLNSHKYRISAIVLK